MSSGKIHAPVKNESSPEAKVIRYANRAVTASILPAPHPTSAMAGATKPTISNGIINPRNPENSPLNVENTLATHSGSTNPAPTPSAIAIAIRRIISVRS